MFLVNGVDEITFCPELSFPEEIFDIRIKSKDFPGRYTFDNLGYFGWTVHRYWLNEKMNMILITAYLKKYCIISFGNFKTDMYQVLVNVLIKNDFPLFGGTNQMINQDRNVMGFPDILVHGYKFTVYFYLWENLIRFSLPFPLVVTYEAIRLRGILLFK